MNNHNTIEKMKNLRLHAMAQVHYASVQENRYSGYSNDEYTALLVDHQWEWRQHRKIQSLIQGAAFRLQASARDVDYTTQRSLDKNTFERLLSLEFLRQKQNIIITGPTGCGKSYLAQAIGHEACTMLHKSLYYNTGRLLDTLKNATVTGSYHSIIKRISKAELLILDDFGLTPVDNHARNALLNIIEDRYDRAATIIASQIPVSKWHELIGESTLADAILDRIVHISHHINLTGESLRKKQANKVKH